MAENHTQFPLQCEQSTLFVTLTHAYLAFKISTIFPFALVVLHLGYRRWRQQRSFATTSHTDVLTYNAAMFDLISTAGFVLFICGELCGLLHLYMMSFYIFAFAFPGPLLLHVLTCLERYLAVVHPVTYLKLKRSGGTWIRNVFLACTWLTCLGWGTGGPLAIKPSNPPMLIFVGFVLVVVTLSSLCVLFVLIRPKPGEGGGANQSRLRAFQTMAIITSALWVWLLGTLVSQAIGGYGTDMASCMVLVSGYWFTVPSHLVLPLLFLHRARKLTGCKSATNNTN